METEVGDILGVIGEYTENLSLGLIHLTNGGVEKASANSLNLDLASILNKTPNLTTLYICGLQGIGDLSTILPLSLTDLTIEYSSISNLNPVNETSSNLLSSLKKLTLINNSNFNSLDGLDKLSEVTTLDLSNNKLDGLTTYTDETGQKKTIDTCQ